MGAALQCSLSVITDSSYVQTVASPCKCRAEKLERNDKMQVLTKQCEIFNCDKKHGNFCCFYCDKSCSNRCMNSPDVCGQYMKPQVYRNRLTKFSGNTIITAEKANLSDCLRKLADYEASGLQPQDLRQHRTIAKQHQK